VILLKENLYDYVSCTKYKDDLKSSH